MTPEPHRRDDATAVALLLGRESFTRWSVAVRCPHDGPAVLENAPTDLRDRPFPTRYWLACRALGNAVSRLEAEGGIRRLEDDPAMKAHIREAHARHAELHEGANIAGSGDAERVKCLHAQLAFALATGGGPIAEWIAAHADISWPEQCCVERFLSDDTKDETG